jgi:hypothetical protein
MDNRRHYRSGSMFEDPPPPKSIMEIAKGPPPPSNHYVTLCKEVTAREDWLPVPREFVRRLGSGPALLLSHLMTLGKVRGRGELISVTRDGLAAQLGRSAERINKWSGVLLTNGILEVKECHEGSHGASFQVTIDCDRVLELLDG